MSRWVTCRYMWLIPHTLSAVPQPRLEKPSAMHEVRLAVSCMLLNKTGHRQVLLTYICTHIGQSRLLLMCIYMGTRLPKAAQQQCNDLTVRLLPYLMSQRLQLWKIDDVCGPVAPWGDLDDVAQAQPHQALHCLIALQGKKGSSASASQMHDPAIIMSTSQHLNLHHTSKRCCHTAQLCNQLNDLQ